MLVAFSHYLGGCQFQPASQFCHRSATVVGPLDHCLAWQLWPAADTVCIGMLQMLKLRSREASAIVKFVFLILLDLAGQFVDFVSFDGCDVIEAWSRAEEPSGLYQQTCFIHTKPKSSALDQIWHQRFWRDKICAWQKLVFPSMKAWKSSIFSKNSSLKHTHIIEIKVI